MGSTYHTALSMGVWCSCDASYFGCHSLYPHGAIGGGWCVRRDHHPQGRNNGDAGGEHGGQGRGDNSIALRAGAWRNILIVPLTVGLARTLRSAGSRSLSKCGHVTWIYPDVAYTRLNTYIMAAAYKRSVYDSVDAHMA